MNRSMWNEPAKIFAVIALAGATICAAHAAAPDAIAASATAVIEQPRPFGYMIGDVFSQRILLQIDGKQFEPAAMSHSERIGVWLERRAPRVETMPDSRQWLVVDYQVINSPQDLALVTIPAWELLAKSGTDSLRIAEWSISVSPLTPLRTLATDGLDELRPDRPAPIIATAPIRRQIAVFSGASVLTVLMWLCWFVWRNWRTSRSQPFGRALREMRRLNDKSPQAWRALHRAFDRVAGQVTQTATLTVLFQRAPQLIPLSPKIEMFFEQSSEFFFGEGLPPAPMSVRKLCVELRRIEKRHER